MKCQEFFSVQYFADGFGNDTVTGRCFQTEQSAKDAIAKAVKKGYFKKGEAKIVRQRFNQNFINYFND